MKQHSHLTHNTAIRSSSFEICHQLSVSNTISWTLKFEQTDNSKQNQRRSLTNFELIYR